MIQATINKAAYNIPTSWDDVSYKQWIGIQQEKDELNLLSILTNIPVELLSNFSNGQINKLALAIQFIQTQPKLEEIKTDIS